MSKGQLRLVQRSIRKVERTVVSITNDFLIDLNSDDDALEIAWYGASMTSIHHLVTSQYHKHSTSQSL